MCPTYSYVGAGSVSDVLVPTIFCTHKFAVYHFFFTSGNSLGLFPSIHTFEKNLRPAGPTQCIIVNNSGDDYVRLTNRSKQRIQELLIHQQLPYQQTVCAGCSKMTYSTQIFYSFIILRVELSHKSH